MRRAPLRRLARAGFTMIEALIVVVMIGVMVGILGPKFRLNEATEVQLAAMQVAQDLDLGRTRALGTRSAVRFQFDTNAESYIGYLDHDRDGAFANSLTETQALRAFGRRELPARIEFGKGSASPHPDDTDPGDSDGVTFDGGRIEYSVRGIVEPLGASGFVYIRSKEDPAKVSAIRVSPSGTVRVWKWQEGAWK